MKIRNFFERLITTGGKLFKTFMILAIFILSILFIVGIYFFGFVGFSNMFNVEYQSLDALLMFLAFFLILSFFTKLIAKSFLIMMAPYLKTKKNIILVKFILEALALWLAIFIVGEMMVTIHIPNETAILGALLLALADVIFSKRRRIIIRKRKK